MNSERSASERGSTRRNSRFFCDSLTKKNVIAERCKQYGEWLWVSHFPYYPAPPSVRVDQIGVEPVRVKRGRRGDRVKLRDLGVAQLQVRRLRGCLRVDGVCSPRHDTETTGLASNQAMAIWATLASCRAAISRIFSTTLNPASLSNGRKSKLASRFSLSFRFSACTCRSGSLRRAGSTRHEARIPHRRNDLVLNVAPDERVIHLPGRKLRPPALFLHLKGGRLSGRPVRKAQVPDFARSHEVVQGF